jgi:nickel transport protein
MILNFVGIQRGHAMVRRSLAGAIILLATALPASAHYNMLLPAVPSGKKGEAVVFVYQWGHPFEHALFDAPKPARVNVLFPDGETHKDLTPSLVAFKQPGAENKQVTSWRFSFTPQVRGDYNFFLETPPIWLDAEKEFVQDIVRVTLHVQTQNGWDNDTGHGLRVVPMTRPYGLLAGMMFQGRLLREMGNGDDAIAPHVEIERYNPTPPKEIPDDELVTFKTRYDPNGVFTFVFPEWGWWSFTAQRDGGTQMRNGKEYPLRQRLTLWVPVEAKK